MPRAGSLIDLHTHSWCSDGTDSPAAVVRAAAAAGVRVLALTDHDVTTGWDEAGGQAGRLGLTLVPGIELSCRSGRVSVHLLAYLPDPGHPDLVAVMEEVRRHRDTRIQTMIERLAADGHPVSYQDVLAHAGPGATLGRPHVADALIRAGRYPDRGAAFAAVLHGSSGYAVPHWSPDPVDTVRTVLAAGGVPVMAHPFASTRGRTVSEEVIGELVGAGLAGLEVDHPDHEAAERDRAQALTRRWGLIATGSSDYHGQGKPHRIGEQTTRPGELARLVDQATGSPVLGAPLP